MFTIVISYHILMQHGSLISCVCLSLCNAVTFECLDLSDIIFVHRFLFICILCVFDSYCIVVVLL